MKARKLLALIGFFIVIFVSLYLYSFRRVMNKDLPEYGISALFDFYEYQEMYRSKNGFYDLNVPPEYLFPEKYKDTVRILLSNSRLLQKFCPDCNLSKSNYKVMVVEMFKTRNYYSVYTISDNKKVKLVRDILCDGQCSWLTIE